MVSGVLVDTTDFKPVDFFQLFFPTSVFQLMSDQSNLYGDELMSNITELSQHSRLHKAVEITPGDMKAYVQTGFECKSCKVPLCPGLCFELYHTVQDFKRAAASQIYGL